MKMPKNVVIAGLAAALTLLAAVPASAQILLQPSGDYRDQLTKCSNWWECYKQEQIEQEEKATATAPPPIILTPITPVVVPLEVKLPNLVPRDSDARFYGSSLQIKTQVDNNGDADAGGFDLRVVVSFARGDTGAAAGSQTVQTFISYLNKGTSWDDVVGFVTPPDRNFDYDVTMTVTADATNAASGGAVWESVEVDNTMVVTCRIYGYADGQGNPGQYPSC